MKTRDEAPRADTETPNAVGSLSLAIVGSGGDGVALLGDLVLRMAAQQGLYGMMVQSYGPQIRGGESAVVLRHGDFPRAVLGVFDVVHAREVMFKAFHLAEAYQLPVLVLSDAYIAQRRPIRDPVVATQEAPRRSVWQPGDGRRASRWGSSTAWRPSAFPGPRRGPTWRRASSTRPRGTRPPTPRSTTR